MRRTLFAFASTFCLSLLWLTSSSFFSEEFGKAGYYADSLHGRKTSSGEKYDKNQLTCAHKSLPFGTKIRVTRLDNHRSVICRVNDRGPYTEGYIVDVSRKAAEELDLIKVSNARVKIEVVEKASAAAALAPKGEALATQKTQLLRAQKATETPRPAAYSTGAGASKSLAAKGVSDPTPVSDPAKTAAPRNSKLLKVDISDLEKKGFGIQVNTLNDADNVLPIIRKLRKEWPDKVMVSVEQDDDVDVSTYRVIIGPFSDRKTADKQQKVVEKKGYKKCFVVNLEEM